MQSKNRGNPAKSTESKAPARGREADPNKDLLIFVLTSLVGQRVTAKLRDNVMYEGIFHSFSADNDYAIVLKSARILPSEMSKSGKVMESLVIPGKDFLQVSALDVPSAATFDQQQTANSGGAFKTDTQISQGATAGGERELVAWGGGDGEDELTEGQSNLNSGNSKDWDQFQVNEQMFGVSTTFNEELYTTPLDPSLIPREKREEADRLAREIECGTQAADGEHKLDGEDDEEGRFSAVHGTGAYKKKEGNEPIAGTGGAAASKAKGANGKGGPSQDAIEELRSRRDANADALSAAVDPRAKRALAGNSPSMKTSMISEMKRINALNLEPAVPKLEDKGNLENFQQQARNASKAAGGSLKMEFQQSLEAINRRSANKDSQRQQQEAQANAGANSDNWRGGKGGNQLSLPPEAMQQGNSMQQRGGGNMQGGDSNRGGGSKFSFNPNAKDFTFNPGAVSFTPGGSNAAPASTPTAGANQNAQAPMAKQPTPMAPSPAFPALNMFNVQNNKALNMSLDGILDNFFGSLKGDEKSLDTIPTSWPEAQGPSYHEVLGQPNPANPMPPAAGNMGPGGPMGAPWPQQQQQQPVGQAPQGGAPGQGGAGGAPQMMPQQNFMVPVPGQQQQQQQMQQGGQMFQPMYQGPGGQMPAQRPQNGPNNMPPQDQQQMGFNQQNMAGPSGMVNPQGMMMQPMPGGAMPKFPQGMQGMQMVMVPQGQGMPPGGMPGHYPQQFQQQGQQGQTGPQPGGPPGGPNPQGHWQQQQQQQQQPQMMPMQMMQGGPRGPPNQMGGHDG